MGSQLRHRGGHRRRGGGRLNHHGTPCGTPICIGIATRAAWRPPPRRASQRGRVGAAATRPAAPSGNGGHPTPLGATWPAAADTTTAAATSAARPTATYHSTNYGDGSAGTTAGDGGLGCNHLTGDRRGGGRCSGAAGRVAIRTHVKAALASAARCHDSARTGHAPAVAAADAATGTGAGCGVTPLAAHLRSGSRSTDLARCRGRSQAVTARRPIVQRGGISAPHRAAHPSR